MALADQQVVLQPKLFMVKCGLKLSIHPASFYYTFTRHTLTHTPVSAGFAASSG